MTHPALPLQAAMFTALSNDAALQAIAGGVLVFDSTRSSDFPRLQIGDDDVTLQRLDCGDAYLIDSRVRAFSRAVGKIEAKQIAARVRFVLSAVRGFTVPGFKMSAGYCESYRLFEDADGLTTAVEINLRYRLT
jgi:hypothetical protein